MKRTFLYLLYLSCNSTFICWSLQLMEFFSSVFLTKTHFSIPEVLISRFCFKFKLILNLSLSMFIGQRIHSIEEITFYKVKTFSTHIQKTGSIYIRDVQVLLIKQWPVPFKNTTFFGGWIRESVCIDHELGWMVRYGSCNISGITCMSTRVDNIL